MSLCPVCYLEEEAVRFTLHRFGRKISTCDMKEWGMLGVRSLSRDGQGDGGQKG